MFVLIRAVVSTGDGPWGKRCTKARSAAKSFDENWRCGLISPEISALFLSIASFQ